MKVTGLALLLALAPAWGQIKGVSTAQVIPSVKSSLPLQDFSKLEKNFDVTLDTAGSPDHISLRGYTRGLYLNGYGTVFTSEVELAVTPALNMFRHSISPQEAKEVHQRKLVNLELLRKAMREMMSSCGAALGSMPANEQIVVAVRLQYQPWEDMTGLPLQIIMRADRASALAGRIQTEEQ